MASTLVLVVVFVLDLIAFALAVAAEQRRSSAKIVTDANSKYCVYDSDVSTGLGVGSLLLLMSSQPVRNAYHTKYRTLLSNNPPSCETLRKGVFGAGAAFIVFTGIFSVLFYVSYSKANDGFLPQNLDAGIRMGSI